MKEKGSQLSYSSSPILNAVALRPSLTSNSRYCGPVRTENVLAIKNIFLLSTEELLIYVTLYFQTQLSSFCMQDVGMKSEKGGAYR